MHNFILYSRLASPIKVYYIGNKYKYIKKKKNSINTFGIDYKVVN